MTRIHHKRPKNLLERLLEILVEGAIEIHHKEQCYESKGILEAKSARESRAIGQYFLFMDEA